MRKTKAQETAEIENFNLNLKGQKEYLISEYNREHKKQNEYNQIVLIVIGITLCYILYLFYIGDGILSKMWHSDMEITLINSIKNTFLLLLLSRTLRLILAVKEEHLLQELFIDKYHKLNIEANGLDFRKYDSEKEVINKLSKFDIFVSTGAWLISYPFLFLGSMFFLSYLGEGLFLASKIKLFQLLGFPIVSSIVFMLLVNGYIEDSIRGRNNIRPVLNSIEILAVIILFMGIFQWL